MWRSVPLCSIVLVGLLHEPLAARGGNAAFTDFDARVAVQRALYGASLRLADPECQSLMTDFEDDDGLPLEAKLNELGMTATEYLADLRFADGTASPLCRYGANLAFTIRNTRTIQVCTPAFKQWSRADKRVVEVIVIHELLHTLGLGENPPTTDAITDRVWERCASVPRSSSGQR
jgi:hypothetical protein